MNTGKCVFYNNSKSGGHVTRGHHPPRPHYKHRGFSGKLKNVTKLWNKVGELACCHKTSFRGLLIQMRVPYCSTLFTFTLFMKFYQYPNKKLLWEKCSVMKIREAYILPSHIYTSAIKSKFTSLVCVSHCVFHQWRLFVTDKAPVA